ncbi:MAG: hypothetical protein IJ043_00455 [Clostridia bacterium]|nr:hypothetical protein [Clostridia bacterium]
MYKKIILFLLAITMTICFVPFSMTAATTPTITYPLEYEEVDPLTALTIRWTPPSSGTVQSYSLTVLKMKEADVDYYTYLVDDKILSGSTTSYTFSANSIARNGLYAINMYALMSDGTMRWAPARTFYTAVHKGVPSNKTISLKIYTGFSEEFKAATYYASRT